LPDLFAVSFQAGESVAVFSRKNALRHSMFLCFMPQGRFPPVI
jgi:hypothetical protein